MQEKFSAFCLTDEVLALWVGCDILAILAVGFRVDRMKREVP